MSTESEVHARLSGDSALVLYFPDVPRERAHLLVAAAYASVAAAGTPAVLDVVPTRTSLTLIFDPLLTTHDRVRALVPGTLEVADDPPPGRRVEIPVLYDEPRGPDLDAVAREAGLSVEQLVREHASREYTVFFLGFQPGFSYMGVLPERLRLPRRSNPRSSVPAGSVAIAEDMTCIYPNESPGGWHVIGRTPVSLFDPHEQPFCLLEPFDVVRFVPVVEEELSRLSAGADVAWREGA